MPDEVWAIPEEERADRAKYDSDLCMLESRFFMRCVLEVPFIDQNGYFGWGCWAEVEQHVFARYLALYETDGTTEPRHPGKIANALPAYEETLGTRIFIQFRQSDKRPSLHLLVEDQSRLAAEQRSGIDVHRHHEILDELKRRD